MFLVISFKAVYNNNTNLVNLLIRAGVNLNIKDKYGLTPLHYDKSSVLSNFKEFLKFDLSCDDEES
jgi:ankyrin repeat protein